jgi:hypothetical protein
VSIFALKLGIVAFTTLAVGSATWLIGWALLGGNLRWTTVLTGFVCSAIGSAAVQTWYGWS